MTPHRTGDAPVSEETKTQSAGAPIAELRDVTKRYRQGEIEVLALRGLTLSIDPGEFATLSGSGTSRRPGDGPGGRGRGVRLSRRRGIGGR